MNVILDCTPVAAALQSVCDFYIWKVKNCVKPMRKFSTLFESHTHFFFNYLNFKRKQYILNDAFLKTTLHMYL